MKLFVFEIIGRMDNDESFLNKIVFSDQDN